MSKRIMTAIYSAAHLFVDFACAFLILRYACTASGDVILAYNFCAFALQMPFGILIDRFGFGHAAAASGCILIVLAYAAVMMFPQAALIPAIIAGVGNALFHLGGGIYVIEEHKGAGALGVFVSPGAIGLYMGTLMATDSSISSAVPIGAMLLSAVSILTVSIALKDDKKCSSESMNENRYKLGKAAAAMLFAVVVLRSFGGFAAELPWKTGMLAFAAVMAAALGKACGGFLADRMGNKKAAVLSLTLAAILYIFSSNAFAGIFAIWLFNMSMPITLHCAADIFKGRSGFSFGMLTFALFVGYIPIWSGGMTISAYAMSGLCVISAVLLAGGCSIIDKGSAADD